MVKEKIAKLIDVKSIVTFVLVTTFCILAFKSVITGDQVNNIVTIVIGFYFGTQAAKAKPAETTGKDDEDGKG